MKTLLEHWRLISDLDRLIFVALNGKMLALNGKNWERERVTVKRRAGERKSTGTGEEEQRRGRAREKERSWRGGAHLRLSCQLA